MHPTNDYKYFYIYKTTNQINGKIYIGIHASNSLENKYLGSGVYLIQAIKKYGRDTFTKEILQIYETYDHALDHERRLITKEFIENPMTYNAEIGGMGGKIWDAAKRKRMSRTKKQAYENGLQPWNKGKHVGNFMTEESRLTLSKKMSGSGNHMYGVDVNQIMSPEKNAERLAKIAKANRKPKSNRDAYKQYARQRFFIVNQHGELKHCVSEDDPRLTSGEFRRGRKWK